MSGFTSPQTTFKIAFIHSTLSGVGGLFTSALLFSRFIRTLSISFSTLRPAFSTPIQTTAAVLHMRELLKNQLNHPICLPRVVKIQIKKQRMVVTTAPVRKIVLAGERSASSSSGGKGWIQMFPTSAAIGAGRRGSCRDGEGGRRMAVPALGCEGSRASLSRPFSRNSGGEVTGKLIRRRRITYL